MSSEMPSAGKPPQIEALTALRFFVAIGIVVHHLYLVGYFDPGLQGFRNLLEGMGNCVAFFFVLSGFILTYSYRPSLGRDLGMSYYVARVARVYPVYLLGLVLSIPGAYRALSFPGSLGVRHDLISPLLLDLFLLQAWCPALCILVNGPGWSLSVEAFFYALFPWLLKSRHLGLGGRMTVVAGVVLWGAGVLPGLAILGWYGSDAIPKGVDFFHSFFPLLRLPEFAMGILAGHWFLGGGRLPAPRRLAAMFLTMLVCYQWLSGPEMRFLGHNALLAPLFCGIILAIASLGDGVLRDILESRFLVVLGQASFSLYILHMPLKSLWTLVWMSAGLNSRGVIFAGTYLVFVIGCSLLAYRFVEVPGREWLKDRLGILFKLAGISSP